MLGGCIQRSLNQLLKDVDPRVTAERVARRVKQTLAARYGAAGLFVVLVLMWNTLQLDHQRFAFANSPSASYLNVDPSRATIILASIDEYTPLIQESSLDLAAQTEQVDGFITTKQLEDPFATEATKLEELYVVQSGDTITGIAEKFRLHVATIVDRNQIGVDEIESLKPGLELWIPPQDTSDSVAWLEELNAKKETERQKRLAEAAAEAARRAKSKTKQSTQRARVAGGFDGNAGMNFIVPLSHNGVSRALQRGHFGIDYRANQGTSVKAAQDGKIIETTGGWAGGFGTSILVDHGGGVTTRYAHLSRIGVSPGEIVSQGQVIGYSGNTGYSTGPHLHFETRVGGRAINPF